MCSKRYIVEFEHIYMVEINTKWLRDVLIIPLIIGLVVAFFQFALPIISEKDVELSYSIEEPKLQIDKTNMGDVKVEINDIETSILYSQSIKIWNSGKTPIKSLPIRYLVETSNQNYKIFFVSHNTNPKYEFGNITMVEETQVSKKYIYNLINPGDQFTITFLTNGKKPQNVYTKGEGLNVKQIKPQDESQYNTRLSIFATAVAFFTQILLLVTLKKDLLLIKLLKYLH